MTHDTPSAQPCPRKPYVTPVLEPLGDWSTLTLQQSIELDPSTGL